MHSNSVSKSKEFIAGFSSPIRVLGLLLEHPTLLALFILPIFLTVLVIACVIYAHLIGVWNLTHNSFQAFMGSHWAWGSGIAAILVAGIVLYFSISIIHLLIQLIASPFNDFLAEKTEMALGEKPVPFRWRTMIRVFFMDLKKTALSLVLTLGLLILGAIPGLGLVSVPGLALVQAFIYLTYPQNRRAEGLTPSMLWIRTHFFRSLGFGLASMILFYTPVINLFALPLSVMAGTLTYLKK